MKQIRNMSQVELAAYVQDALQADGIEVVLSGGSAASFYSNNKYISKDLDLINTGFAKRSKIKSTMENLISRKKDVISFIQKRLSSLNFLMDRFPWVKSQ